MPLLEVHGVSAGYGNVPGVRDLSYALEEGEVLAFLGPNGAGKTTAVEATVGLVKKFSGRVLFNGEDVTRYPASTLARRGVALVPQWRDLFSTFSILETLDAARVGVGRSSRFSNKVIFDLFPSLARRSAENVHASMLSGGEQQMLAIARALATEPKVLLVDELSIGLSVGVANTLVETLLDIQKSGLALLVVEQNSALAARLARDCIIFEAGRSAWRGPVAVALEQGEIARYFLGETKAG